MKVSTIDAVYLHKHSILVMYVFSPTLIDTYTNMENKFKTAILDLREES